MKLRCVLLLAGLFVLVRANDLDSVTINVTHVAREPMVSMPSYPCPAFRHMENLVMNCSHMRLAHIPTNLPPSTSTLLLHHNNLEALPPNAFANLTKLRHLDLSYNPISTIDRLAFNNLSVLNSLDLTENSLCAGTDSFPVGLFRRTPQLEVLRLTGQECTGIGDVDMRASETFRDLTNLKELYLTRRSDAPFDGHFEELKALIKLSLTGNSAKKQCYIPYVAKETLKAFRGANLTELNMRKCNIKTAYPDSFFWFPNIRILNLACNPKMKFDRTMNLVNGIGGTGDLHTLVLDNVYQERLFSFGSKFASIIRSKFCTDMLRNLRRLSIRNNLIQNVDVNVLECLPHLEHIAIGYNNFSLTGTRDNWIEKMINHLNSMKIHTIDASYYGIIPEDSRAFSTEFCVDDKIEPDDFFTKPPNILPALSSKPEPIVVNWTHVLSEENDTVLLNLDTWDNRYLEFIHAPSLLYVYLDHLGEGVLEAITNNTWSLGSENNLQLLDFSHNNMDSIRIPVTNFEKLQLLDVGHCGINEMLDNSLALHSLTHLYVDHNNLSYCIDNFTNNVRDLVNIQLLDMSFNGMHSLEPNIFNDTIELQEVNLSYNAFQDIILEITHLENLTSLDLSGNHIAKLDKVFSRELDDLANISNFKVNLLGNPMACKCSSIEFITWMQKTQVLFENKEQYKCTYQNKSTPIVSFNVTGLKYDCEKRAIIKGGNTVVIIATVLPLLILLLCLPIILFLVIRRRQSKTIALPQNESLMNSSAREHCIEPIVEQMIIYIRENGMEREGIFRRSCNQRDLNQVMQNVVEHKPVNFGEYGVDIPADMLKKYLGQHPPLNAKQYNHIITLQKTQKDRESKIEKVQTLLKRLGNREYYLLEYVIGFLNDVAEKSDLNKMTSQNLSIVFGPNLVHTGRMSTLFVSVDHINGFIEFLINNYTEVFTRQRLEPDTNCSDV